MDMKRGRSLYTIFLKYLIIFCVLSIILIFSLIITVNTAINFNIIKPANYVQNQVENLKIEVERGSQLDEDKIPYPSKYAFFNNENEIVKTNLDEEELKEVNKYLDGERGNSKFFYTKIPFNSGICIIRYDIKAHFTSKFWNDLIPYPEILLISIFLIGFILTACIIAIKFEKKLKKELYPLKASTEKIMNQDLDFEVIPSDVKEFNEVLTSISNMKTALKKSLKEQWHIEQEKENQISALAHDIKTPITIIKGNAELLNESDLCEEDKEFAKYIINNADKIEKYISTLIDISKSGMGECKLNENINTDIIIDELKGELNMICSLKDIKIITSLNYKSKFFVSNKDLLKRAIINIMLNAVDYSPEKSEIEFIVNENEEMLEFTIRDSGKGFTENGLRNATNQFFMEASERKVGKHYGMGLYIAESVARMHGGFVVIKNREYKTGAEVSLAINIKS
ncbi:HAMP domain-containing histidine kinase [Romboutsia hominis]|uniref:histidine kinase n=1 Tax=Romboutsia faecis TaxID=2764597 RepID=A0ABR7JPH9_9FIRM|nr:HAMP domain-containing sensor histidine kinase [Romboutsia faecis]MBC5996755.1 HAMP domain-containing histidine kinase [Romboutsia faecis]